MHVLLMRTYQVPSVNCGAVIYIKKTYLEKKLFVKEYIVCRSFSGPSTVRRCQANIGPIICRYASHQRAVDGSN